ncbi:MAG: lysophospholipid acyltransferase family protein [Pseudomonadota bacterium]
MTKGTGAVPDATVPSASQEPRSLRSRFIDLLIRVMVGVPKILPWRMRLAVSDFLMAWIIAPIVGYRRRIRDNLALVCPDLPEKEVARLCRRVPGNVGRFVAEVMSPKDFFKRATPVPVTGAGVDAFNEALEAKRPLIFISGHFGNFDAARVAFVDQGRKIGALYRPNEDPYVDAHYTAMLSGIAEPIFPRGRRGLGAMIKFLRAGNALAILVDQHVKDGAILRFFGKPAATTLSPAELALKYDALLIPCYGIRRGQGYEVVIESPIPHSTPEVMMQAFNDSLEARVRADMDQWLWIHRRWKSADDKVA